MGGVEVISDWLQHPGISRLMQPHHGFAMFGRCIICICGPVDLPSLIGSSSTAEPLTAYCLLPCLNMLAEHH